MRDWVFLTSLLWRHIALLPAMPSIGSLCGKGAEHVKKKGTGSIDDPSVEQEGSDDERGPRDVAK